MTLNRFQAFGWHLLGSFCVGLCSAALVFFIWYRWPLAIAAGVTNIFLLLLAVDVVIGPFITLVVFNTKKKELKRDLAIVLLLQIGALFYGLHTVFLGRPVYLVYNVDRFDLVYANDLDDEKLSKVSDLRFKSLPLFGADIIGARKPDDAKAKNEMLISALQGGDDLPQLPQYYVPYASLKEDAKKLAKPLEDLKPFNKDRAENVAALIAKYGASVNAVGFLPLRGKTEDLTVIIDRASGEVLEVKNLKPWA